MSTATVFQRVAYQAAAARQGLAPLCPRDVFILMQIYTPMQPNTIIRGMLTAGAYPRRKNVPLDVANLLGHVPPTPVIVCITTRTITQTPPSTTSPPIQ